MATLVLTAVGTAIGGPVGGAIGALLGGAVDRRLFGGPGREGPRLSDLKVQTSSYGAAIPELFGTIRVAGTVIWATELQEHRSTSRSKGAPSVTSYSYTASFAVLLSARTIVGIGRIWADGKLLRGASGDLKAAGRFRWHGGGEDQPVDPLIASAEGMALTPACRGQAYAVFEDLALADFGNRIPSLTFEVIADAGPVSAGAIVEAISRGRVAAGEATTAIDGFSAYGAGAREVIDALARASGAWFAQDGGRLALRVGSGSAVAIDDAGCGGRGRGVRKVSPVDTVPRSLAIAHYDAARDYQAGVQRADRPGPGTRALRIDLPAVIGAGAAKAMAATALARIEAERERRNVAIDWRRIAVAPGDRVTIGGEAGVWRVSGWSLEGMVLVLELRRVTRAAPAAAASSGRLLPAPDLMPGATVVHAFEIPPIGDEALSAPRLTIAAAGTGAGWRSAVLQLSGGDGVWTTVGGTAPAATLGWVAQPPGGAPATLVDRRNAIEVTLAGDAMELFDADDAALDRGANLALVGEELLQFGRAERMGEARWRLSDLWRGRRGTEWAAGAAMAGDQFVLLDPATLREVTLPGEVLGSAVQVMASGVGDDEPVSTGVAIGGASVVPPAPVRLSVKAIGSDLHVAWVRRSRVGWRWTDGIDAPLGEEAERYGVTAIDAGGSVVFDTVTDTPVATVTAAGVARIEVRMIGTFGRSRPASIMIGG